MAINFISGAEAVANAAIRVGVRFYGGYPITPSSEIAEEMSKLLPKVRGVFVQFEDEIASLAACIGARVAGLKSMTATSGPGFSLMQEHIGYASMTEIPVLIVNVMRGGPSTGLPTMPSQMDVMQARWGTHGDHPIYVITATCVQELYENTIEAVNMSERLRMPVILLTDEVTIHLRERIDIPEEISIYSPQKNKISYRDFKIYGEDTLAEVYIPPFGEGFRYHITGLVHGEDGFPTNNHFLIKKNIERFKKKMDIAKRYVKYEEYQTQDAEYLIVSYGISFRASLKAGKILRDKGVKIGLFKVVTLWPSPEDILKKYDGAVKKVFVPELNQGQYFYEIDRIFKKSKVVPINRYDGDVITPEEIVETILNEI